MRTDIVAQALKAIEDATGRLTPDAVVKAAKPEKHPLHSRFEWDDKRAGHQFRLEQARDLIKSVQIVYITEHRQVSAVAYMRDPSVRTSEQGYRHITRIKSEPDEAQAALVEEFKRAEAHLRRVRDAATYLGMADAVDQVIEQLGIVQVRALEAMAAA